jgi:hypothetical protein
LEEATVTFEDFEEVEKLTHISTNEPRVRFGRKDIDLNEAAYNGLGRPEAVALLFDKERYALGLRPISPEAKHAYSIHKVGNNRTYRVKAMAFVSHNEIATRESRSYHCRIHDHILVDDIVLDGILIFDLKQADQKAVMPYRFHEFKDKKIPAKARQMRLTLQKEKDISFNRAVYEALGKPVAVILGFNRKTREVMIKPADPSLWNSRPIRRMKPGYTYVITANRLVSQFNIEIGNFSMVYRPKVQDGVVVFKIDKGTSVKGRKMALGRPRAVFNFASPELFKEQVFAVVRPYYQRTGKLPTGEVLCERLRISRATLYANLKRCNMSSLVELCAAALNGQSSLADH